MRIGTTAATIFVPEDIEEALHDAAEAMPGVGAVVDVARAPLRRRSWGATHGPIGYGCFMAESLRMTVVFEQGQDGWIVASVPEVPGVHSQGRTREEARANVVDALRGMLELRFGVEAGVATDADSEPLELVIGA
jgi:predicted RNase H-like HicB family nuclease